MKRRNGTAALGALLIMIGCASGDGTGGVETGAAGPGMGVAIEVRNDMTPPQDFTIWIGEENNPRVRLGNIAPNDFRTFRYDPGRPSAMHILVARTAGRGDRRSRPFTIAGATRVVWRINSNSIAIR